MPAGGVSVLAHPDARGAVVAELLEGHEVLVLGRRGDWVHVDAGGGVDGWVDGRALAGVRTTATATATAATAASPRHAGASRGLAIQLSIGPVVGALGAVVAIVGALLPWQQTVADRLSVSAFDLPLTFLAGWDHLGDGGFSIGAFLVLVAGIGIVASLIAGGGLARRILGAVVVLACVLYVLQQQAFLTSNDLGLGTGLNVWDIVDFGVVVSFAGGLAMTFAPRR